MKLVKIVAFEILGCMVHVNLEPVTSIIPLMYIVNVACTSGINFIYCRGGHIVTVILHTM